MEVLAGYRNDRRYAMFSLWTDVKHQDIALRIIDANITLKTLDDHARDDELYELYAYVFDETHYVCGRCKTLVPDFDAQCVYDIALDPSILFEGDVLICWNCSVEKLGEFKKTNTNPRVCSYANTPENFPKFSFDIYIPTYPYIYNVIHDYYTTASSVMRMRNGSYPLSLIHPYHNFRELSLFELLQKTIDCGNLKVPDNKSFFYKIYN